MYSLRLEYKYLVPKDLVGDIRSAMRPFVEIDTFADRRDVKEYTVRSIYFDTLKYDCYFDKLEGIKTRKKFRIRGYNHPDSDSIVFLEIKRKYLNYIEKSRAPLYKNNIDQLFLTKDMDKYIISLNGNGEEQDNARRFLYNFYKKSLRPTILIVYEREAFYGKFNKHLRLTFDKYLRSTIYPSLDQLFKEDKTKHAMPKYFILEVKFYNGLPAWIRNIVRTYDLHRMALSKYTISLDSHRDKKTSLRMLSTPLLQNIHWTNHLNRADDIKQSV